MLAPKKLLEIPVDDTIFVAPSGSDTLNDGSFSRPFQTFHAAVAAYALKPAGNYVIDIAPGSYNGAPIVWPIAANRGATLRGAGAGCTSLNVDIAYTSLGLSDEYLAATDLSINGVMTFDMTLGGVVNVILAYGRYQVKRIDALPPGPQSIRMFNCFADGFDISGTCLMTDCQFVGGASNFVRASGLVLMTSCLFASMSAQVDGTLSLVATLALGTTLTGTGIVAPDATSSDSLIVSGPSLNLVDKAYAVGYQPSTPADWVALPSEVEDALDQLGVSASAKLQQVVYVAKNGSDVTGNGSQARPYASLTAALASITDNTDAKKYLIAVAPGSYNEAALTIKPNVDIAAFTLQDESGLLVRLTAGALALDPAWGAGTSDTRTVIKGVVFDSPGTIDNTLIGAVGALTLSECTFNAQMDFLDPGKTMALLARKSTFFNVVNFTGFNQINGEMNIQGATASYTTSPGAATIMALQQGIIIAAFTVTANVGESVNCFLRNNQILAPFGGSLTANGAGAVVIATVDSLCPSSSITLLGGATLQRVNDAGSLGYVAAAPANWAGSPPEDTQTALDRLAAAVAGLLGGPIP